MGTKTAIMKRRLMLPPEFVGRDALLKQWSNYPMLDRDDLLDASALVSMLPSKGEIVEDRDPPVIPHPSTNPNWEPTESVGGWTGAL